MEECNKLTMMSVYLLITSSGTKNITSCIKWCKKYHNVYNTKYHNVCNTVLELVSSIKICEKCNNLFLFLFGTIAVYNTKYHNA